MCHQSYSRFLRRVFGGLLLLAATPSFQTVAQSLAAVSFRVVSCKVVAMSGTDYMLEQGVLGTNGATIRSVRAIPRGFAVEAAVQSGARNLFLLRKMRGDTVMLLLTDSLGRTLQQPRLGLPKMSGDARKLVPPRLFGLPGGKGFVLTYPSGKSARPALQVRALSPALSVLWQQQFTPTCITSVEHITASDTHLWLVLREYLALALRPRVLSLRLPTGEMECNQPLAPNDELDAATVVPAGLLILGTSDRRTSYVAPPEPLKTSEYRRDFALLLIPTGQRAFGVGLGWPPPGRPPRYRWQSACPLPDGGYQLVGETFRKAPNAGTIALGLLGAGIIVAGGVGLIPLGGYLNERPVGLVLAQLSATGQLAAVHELVVPEVLSATESKTVGTDFTKDYRASFRFRGFSPNNNDVVLNTSRQVLAYSLATRQLRPLTAARNAVPAVLYIEAGHVAVSWSLNSAGTVSEFEQIALP